VSKIKLHCAPKLLHLAGRLQHSRQNQRNVALGLTALQSKACHYSKIKYMTHALPNFTAFTNFSQWPMNNNASAPAKLVIVPSAGALEDALAAKAMQLNDPSEQSKLVLKEFSKNFRNKIKDDDCASAYAYGLESLERSESQYHWKICMEIADLAKKKNLFDLARFWFKKATYLQPFSANAWVEYAKLEEEHGDLEACRNIIRDGLAFVPLNEVLLIKLVKIEERMDRLDHARVVLSRLSNLNNERTWKTIFEGALMEARAGNVSVARSIFQYLMHHVHWYGPVYQAAFSLEEKHGFFENAYKIVQQGLECIPHYGPLWFAAFKLYEMFNYSDKMLQESVSKAVQLISRELIWKIYFEAGLIEERRDCYDRARQYFVKSIKYCPENLRWRVWLGGARAELRAGRLKHSRVLLNRAMEEVPQKSRAMVLLECSRLEEYCGNIYRAREILERAKNEACYEWKVFLESVVLEIRCRNYEFAMKEASNALQIHSGTGRLWAILIQLKQFEGPDEQLRVFKHAYQEVPKSGEVWCEGARIYMDPTSHLFDLQRARRYLEFAIKFTPQYGDSFVELIRLEMLEKGVDYMPVDLIKQCINADPNYGAMWFRCKESVLDTALQVFHRAQKVVMMELYDYKALYQRAILQDKSNVSKDFLQLGQLWKESNMNSLEHLYPSSESMPLPLRHRLLFGSAASFHD
jgi:tetratricopeptide (TPR) repeat protein